jgi:hypothetical protein
MPSFRRPTAVPSFRPTVPARPRAPQFNRPTPVPSIRPNVIAPRPNPNFRPGTVRPSPARPSLPPSVTNPIRPPSVITPRPGRPTTSFRPNIPPNVATNRPWFNMPLNRNWPQNRGAFGNDRWEQWRHTGNWNDFVHNRGNIVRNQFHNNFTVNRFGPMFTPTWFNNTWRHGFFWNSPVATPWFWWNFATIPLLNNWLAWNAVTPLYYNYGDNFIYDNGTVYYDQQPLGPVDTYIDQATQLALAGTQSLNAGTQFEWMPLGVFALTHGDQVDATMYLQLAVTKNGLVGGTFRNTATDQIQTISGQVDPKTQRAAWTIGDTPGFIMEAGIYNLTQDQAPVLIHWGTDLTQTWLLTRVPAPQQ